MPNQHPSISFLAMPPTAMPSGATQVQSLHRTRVQLGVGQAHTYQGTREGPPRNQIPFGLPHCAQPVNGMTVYPPHSGEQHSFVPGHGVR